MTILPGEEPSLLQTMAKEPPAPDVPAAPKSIADTVENGTQDTARLEIARQVGADIKPDQAARVLRLSMQTELPTEFVAANADDIEKRVAAQGFSAQEFRKSSPQFASWLAANPHHYALAKDDLGIFGNIEKAFGAFKQGVESMPVQHELAVLQNKDMDQGLTAGEEIFKKDLEDEARAQQLAAESDGMLSKGTRLVGSTAAQLGMFAFESAKGAMAGATAGGVIGAATPFPGGAAAGMAAGAPAGALTAAGAYIYHLERGAMYDELKNITDIDGKPIDKKIARNIATAFAAAEGVATALTGAAASEGAAARAQSVRAALAQPTTRTALLAAAKNMTESGGVMAAIGFFQSLTHSAARETAQAFSPAQTFAPDSAKEDFKKAGTAAAEGFVGMFLTAGITHGIPTFMGKLREADRASKAEQFYQALGQGKDSVAFKNLPDKAQEAIAAIISEGGTRKTAYVDTQAWTEFFQKAGVDPREAAAEVLGDPKAFDEAVKAGQELPIPIERYARKIAVNPQANQFFSQELRYEPGAMNAREARVLFQKIEEEARLMPASEHFGDAEAKTGIAAVKEDVIKQLKAAGVDDRTARTQAELLSGFESLGQRAGIEPSELYGRYVLKIRNAEQVAAEEAAGKGGAAPAETFFQRAKRVVTDALGITAHPGDSPEIGGARGEEPALGNPGAFDAKTVKDFEQRSRVALTPEEKVMAELYSGHAEKNPELMGQAKIVTEIAARYKQPALDAIGKRLADQVGGTWKGRVKSAEGLVGKVIRKINNEGKDYHPLKAKDVTAGTITADSWDKIISVIKELKAKHNFALEATIDHPLNKFGYRGVQGAIDLGDGFAGEIQLQGPDFPRSETHKIYDKWRMYDETALEGLKESDPERYKEWVSDLKRSRDIYDAYWAAVPEETRAAISALDSGRELETEPSLTEPSKTQDLEAGSKTLTESQASPDSSTQQSLPSGSLESSEPDGSRGASLVSDSISTDTIARDRARRKGLLRETAITELLSRFPVDFKQDENGDVRGRLRIGANRQVNLDLLKKANLSTFVHELWHFYFEVMGDLSDELSRIDGAKRTRGQQGIIDDFGTLLKHVGAGDRKGITTDMHESIARLGEAYVMEGKAPSSELRRTFARFKVWLTHIYRDIKSLAVDLKPEVSKVFDRMLATDDAIERAEREQNVAPLFDDPHRIFGEKDGDKYLAAVADARAEAEAELSAKVMADVRREQEAWWKTERAKVQEEIAREVDAQPVYKALAALTSRDPDAPQIKLDRQAVEESGAMEASKKALPRGITAKEGGLAPAVVAEMFGFKNAYELLDALAMATPRKELLERLTDERMADVHGDLAQEAGRLHEEALSAVHNKKRSELLRRELELLAEKHMPELKGMTAKIARRPPTVAEVRALAEGMVRSRRVGDISPIVYERAEAKAGKEAVELYLKGDFDASFAAKQREFLNHELFRAAKAASEDVEKTLERFKKLGRDDGAIAKNRDIDLVNAARAVLATFGIGKPPKENAVGYLEQMARYDPDMYATVRVLVDQAKGGGTYESATYEQFVSLRDTVDALWDLSRRTRQIMIDGKLLDREQVMGELSNRIAEIGGAGKRTGYDRAVSNWEKAKLGLMGIRASLRRIESWVDAMDGGDRNGVFRRYIWTPISEATSSYRLDKRAYLERYLAIVKNVGKSLTFKEIAAPELGYTFRDKAELLGALLHAGNESNLSKLLRGRGWGDFIPMEDGEKVLDRSKWDSFTARARAEGILTRADYDYAQAVWDLLEELKPRAQKAHKDMYGYYFGEITADPFVASFPARGEGFVAPGAESVEYRGGYVPAVTDPFMAFDAAVRQEREDIEKGNNSFMFPTAGRGFTKGRVENYAAPLMMDVRFIPGHIDKVLRFLHIEPRVKDVARIVMDRNFRKTLDSFDPAVGGDMLVPWLQRAAQQKIETPSQGWGGRAADTFFRTLRSRTGLSIMFANVSNTLQQPFDLSRTFVKVDASYMRDALWRYVRRPRELAEEIAGKSEFMATRETARVMEVQQALDDLMLDPSKYEQARAFAARHGYFMQSAAQNQVDTISWAAAYDKAVAEGAGEKEAVRFADSVVRETQGSMAAEDVSRFETGSPFQRAFTMFYGYFNMQANLLGTEFATVARDIGLKKGAGRMLYAYAFGFMIPALMSEAVVRALSGKGLDENDDGNYLDDAMSFFFGSQFRNATAMFPFVGPTLNAAVNAWNDKAYDDRITTSPAISTIESAVASPHSVYQALQDKTKSKKAIRDSLTLIGLLSGLPTMAAARPLGYLADVNTGKARPKNGLDFARGLISGHSGKP